MKTLLCATAVGTALLLSAGALAAHAQEAKVPGGPADMSAHMLMMPRGPVLSLSAYGETRAAPNLANLNLGVTTEASSAAAAMRDNRERMSKVIAALKAQGVEPRDIQTSNLSLQPQYDYRDNTSPVLRGYQASNQVTITVRDLSKLGATVDAVTGAGGNQVNGISFGLKDPQTAENAARLAAVKALQAKADLYAQATGYRLKGLRSLSEGVSQTGPRPFPVMAMRKAEAAPTPVEAGELTLRVDVEGVFDLEK